MEKCGKIWKNGRFSGRLRPDWGDTARAATAGLGSIGLNMHVSNITHIEFMHNRKCHVFELFLSKYRGPTAFFLVVETILA